jgi:hypothetical protein
MKFFGILWVALALILAGCATETPAEAPAGEAAKPAAGEAPAAAPATAQAPKAAIFLVGEELEGPKIQALGTALVGLDGILAAKPDPVAGTFVVTFTPGAVTPEVIGERLKAAAPGAEFMGLTTPTEVPDNHDDCNKCPYKEQCSGAK